LCFQKFSFDGFSLCWISSFKSFLEGSNFLGSLALFSAFFKTMIALASLALMAAFASGSAFLSYLFREMTLFRALI